MERIAPVDVALLTMALVVVPAVTANGLFQPTEALDASHTSPPLRFTVCVPSQKPVVVAPTCTLGPTVIWPVTG